MRKKLGIIIVTLFFLCLGVPAIYLYSERRTEKDFLEDNLAFLPNAQTTDLDGDGRKDVVINNRMYNQNLPSELNVSEFLTATLRKGRQEVKTPEALKPPNGGIRMAVEKLDNKGSKEYLRIDFIAGPHQFESMYFTYRDGRIVPVCLTEAPKGTSDCLFYVDSVGGLVTEDLDGDGKAEMIETLGEYPTDGELTREEEEAIKKVFEKEGVDEYSAGAKRIAIREKGGRGRTVVAHIYSFNGNYFEMADDEKYNRLYSLIGDHIPNKVHANELSDESIDYLDFVQRFWTNTRP